MKRALMYKATYHLHRIASFRSYGVATIIRLLKIIGLFCKRALWKRRYSAKETYNFKESTNRSHPMHRWGWKETFKEPLLPLKWAFISYEKSPYVQSNAELASPSSNRAPVVLKRDLNRALMYFEKSPYILWKEPLCETKRALMQRQHRICIASFLSYTGGAEKIP